MTFITNPGAGTSSPVFDYSSRDYNSVVTDLLNRIPVYLPEWTSRSPSDFGIVLLQLFAYVCDILSYYEDRLAGEAFLQTATQPQSIINLAGMLGYTPALSNGATVTLTVNISTVMNNSQYPVVLPVGTQFSTNPSQNTLAIPFVTTEELSIPGPTAATPSFVGTVLAEQGILYSQPVATSDGTINQSYSLLHSPVSAESLSVTVDLGFGPQTWSFVASLVDSGPNDQVYTTFVDANQIMYVIFGDGVNGFVPTLGSPIAASYMTNVGDQGNVGPNTIIVFVGPPAGGAQIIGITSVTNGLGATGGANAESVQSIQVNAPAALRALYRGVTTTDISTLAQNISGVQWASAVEVTYQLVNLFIAPHGGGTMSSILQNTIQNQMNAVVMANTTVTLLNANYISVDITVQVVAFENFADATVQSNVVDALSTLLSLTQTGFGFRVTLGLVYETVLDVPGVNYCFVTELNREVLTTLLSPLASGTGYNSLSVTELPQQVNAGDTLIISNGTNTQTVTAAGVGQAGANTISVFNFTAGFNFPIQSTVRDVTLLTDAVMLPSEIPVAGAFTVTVTGGIPAS